MTRQWVPYMELRMDILGFIDEFTRTQGYPPVNIEIAEKMGYSRAWASMTLDRMERDGLITRSRETGVTRRRTIRLSRAGAQVLKRGR